MRAPSGVGLITAWIDAPGATVASTTGAAEDGATNARPNTAASDATATARKLRLDPRASMLGVDMGGGTFMLKFSSCWRVRTSGVGTTPPAKIAPQAYELDYGA